MRCIDENQSRGGGDATVRSTMNSKINSYVFKPKYGFRIYSLISKSEKTPEMSNNGFRYRHLTRNFLMFWNKSPEISPQTSPCLPNAAGIWPGCLDRARALRLPTVGG